jgi:hypothetical protein
MTKSRLPGTIHEAVSRVLGSISPAEAARVVGKSVGHVYKWGAPVSDDDDVQPEPKLSQAIALDAAYMAWAAEHPDLPDVLSHPPILAAYAAILEGFGAPRRKPADPRDRLTTIMAEVGDVAGAVRDALADGAVSTNERARIAKEAGDAVTALQALLDDMGGQA